MADESLGQIVAYMKAHWPSEVKTEWQVGLEEYPEILKRVLADLVPGKTNGKKFVRIAGQSGSGKTTQLLPATEAYFKKNGLNPVMVAARIFVKYHPFYSEILEEYGEASLRKMTDEFATIMMFLTLRALISRGYDLVLDVTLLDPMIEGMLMQMLGAENYDSMMLMIAVSPEVTEKFLGGRAWRHTKETEQEFIRATKLAMEFYAEKCPDMRIVMWNVYEDEPVYDGDFSGALSVWQKYSDIVNIPDHDEEKLRAAKIKYLEK